MIEIRRAASWRDVASPIIAAVIDANPGKDRKELRKLLREAYPFVERRYFPYKVWCDEVRIQLGEKQRGRCVVKRYVSARGQRNLFT